MESRTGRGTAALAAVGLCALVALCGTGCAGALVAMTVAGSAAAMSGEPQRAYGTQGQDFDERCVSLIRTGVDTPADVVSLLGDPQTKIFTHAGEEWSYRYYAPGTMLRSGVEKILTVRFRGGKVDDVRYTLSAL